MRNERVMFAKDFKRCLMNSSHHYCIDPQFKLAFIPLASVPGADLELVGRRGDVLLRA